AQPRLRSLRLPVQPESSSSTSATSAKMWGGCQRVSRRDVEGRTMTETRLEGLSGCFRANRISFTPERGLSNTAKLLVVKLKNSLQRNPFCVSVHHIRYGPRNGRPTRDSSAFQFQKIHRAVIPAD